jgi:hypothetical protein
MELSNSCVILTGGFGASAAASTIDDENNTARMEWQKDRRQKMELHVSPFLPHMFLPTKEAVRSGRVMSFTALVLRHEVKRSSSAMISG